MLPVFNIWVPQGELLYLSNSPLCLFAAIWLAAHVWQKLVSGSIKNIITAVPFAAGFGVVIAAMLLDVQRATIGAALFSMMIFVMGSFCENPKKTLWPLTILCLTLLCLYPLASDILNAIQNKTEQVGLNMRVEEARAVYQTLAHDPVSMLIGQGWGSEFASPAVGGLTVNYTHSFLTTLALKGGLPFLTLGFGMFVAGLYQIMLIFQRQRGQAMALFWPFVIPVFFYASHKSLDFGLVLLMLSVWAAERGSLPEDARSCKTKALPAPDFVTGNVVRR